MAQGGTKVSTLKTDFYSGVYKLRMLDGYRIVMPSQIRNILGKEAIITKGFEANLIIVDIQRWEHLIGPLKNVSFLNTEGRDTLRFLVGSAYHVSLDRQGRLVIPKPLRKSIKLKTQELYCVGVYNWIELWDPAAWHKKERFLEKNVGDIAQQFVQAS